MKIQPGWAVEVRGDKIDLDDLKDFLISAFDPWVEEYTRDGTANLLLRSHDWTNLTEARGVFEDASRILAQAHGAALLIHHDAISCAPGGVYRLEADGKRHVTMLADGIVINVPTARARGRSPAPANPSETRVQALLRVAKQDDRRAELLLHLGRADNWFDLYKCMELAESLRGGNHSFVTSVGVDGAMWDMVRQTANHYRHAPIAKKNPLPDNPPKLKDARNFVLRVIAATA